MYCIYDLKKYLIKYDVWIKETYFTQEKAIGIAAISGF